MLRINKLHNYLRCVIKRLPEFQVGFSYFLFAFSDISIIKYKTETIMQGVTVSLSTEIRQLVVFQDSQEGVSYIYVI